jgi:hypothetical protein
MGRRLTNGRTIMRSLRLRFGVRRLMWFVAAFGVVLAFGSGTSISQYSCHICHNRKEVSSKTILLLPVRWQERATSDYSIPANHHHQW